MVGSMSGINGLFGQVGSSATGVSPYSRGEAPRYNEPEDRVTLSAQARRKNTPIAAGPKDEQNLNAEEKQQVNELKKRDTEVKAHEQAHMAAGGGIVQGGAAYQYEHGPDGKMYAVGGEVKIDVSPERTPEATIRKMQQVQRAALAPAQPSATDRAVAAQAAQAEAQARMETSESDGETSEAQGDQASAPDSYEAVDGGDSIANPTSYDPILSYRANLSPNIGRASKATGSKIDLSA